MKIALINSGSIVNIIEADTLAFAQGLGYDEAVEVTDDVHMHGTYAVGVFTPPPSPPSPPPLPVTTMTRLAFVRRLTSTERKAIRKAKNTDENVDDAEYLMGLAQDIDVADADTVQYINYLASIGLITASRVAEILAPVS
jgi:hypothetical protein